MGCKLDLGPFWGTQCRFVEHHKWAMRSICYVTGLCIALGMGPLELHGALRIIMRSHAGLIIRHCEAQQGFTDHPVVAEL